MDREELLAESESHYIVAQSVWDAQTARIAELEAQLAAVPKWVQITDDPATWPPDDDTTVIENHANGYTEKRTARWLRHDIESVFDERNWLTPFAGWRWLPITPPTEEAWQLTH